MIYKAENINDKKYTDSLFGKAYDAMTPERQAKADRYKHKEDKRLCVFADMLLREMLREHFGIENPDFSEDENGKPVLKNHEAHFSISHSGCFVACAADRHPVGIDIEAKRLVSAQILRKVCTQEELNFIFKNADIPTGKEMLSEEESLRFLQVWTAKESYLKYTGKGLSGGLQNVCTVENAQLKTALIPDLMLTNKVTPEYILSVVSEEKVF